MALWRGGFLEDLRDQPWVAAEAVPAEELRRNCLDYRISALLALGRVPAALAASTQLTAADPLSDRGCWLHVLALYRSGRTSDALDAYTRHAHLLDEELGLEPGAELRDLQTAILRQAPELAAWPRHPEWTGAVEVVTPTNHPPPLDATVELAAARPAGGAANVSWPPSQVFSATRRMVPPAGWCCPVRRGSARRDWPRRSPPGSADGGGRVVWISCPDESATPPWWPMRQLVRALGADADELLQVPQHADPDTARFHVYERIQGLLESTGDLRAVVVDDVQWADSASTSCLAYIAGALRDHPIAFVVTVRDGEHTQELRRLLGTVARGPHNRHIEVPALSSRDVAALATEVADDAVTRAEAATLAERTGGNPFFVCEYARLPRDERQGNDIPVAVKSVLDRRLAGLDPAVLQMLRAAAVIGDTVDVAVLAKATRLDLDTLADYLDEAADERIVVPPHTGDGYAFAHGLLREQLIASMPALRRQRLHAKVAEVLADARSMPTR